MDRDSEQADRAARGRRIFDALRRGRPEDEVDDAPGTGDTSTPTVVDDRDDRSPEQAVEPERPPATDADRGTGGVSTAAEDADQAGEPGAEGDESEPTPESEPAPRRPEPDGPLPGVEKLQNELGAPEVAAAPAGEPPIGDAAVVEGSMTPAPPGDEAAEAEAVGADEPETEAATHPAEADARPPPSDALPRVIAIANQKGGVGKTTTAVNLGASLSELGYRVLIVDLDPQGNATTGLGIDIRNLDGSVYESIMGDAPLEDCIEATSVRNLFVAPSNMDLAGAEIELVPVFSRELKLRRAIEGVKDDYDFILIDCPPSLGLLTVNGLAAADDVVVPIQCEYYALEGLGQLVNNVNLVRANLNPVLDIRGIVLTMYDARTKLADQVVQEVRSHFGDRAYETVVPRTVRLSEAPSYGQPIIVFDNSSRGSDAYRSLAQEVAERVAGRPRDPVMGESDRDD